MKKQPARHNPNIHYLWPTAILTRRFGQHQGVNRALLELFYRHRETHQGGGDGAVFASSDDLPDQYPDHPELKKLIKFILDGVFEISATVNTPYWPKDQSVNINLTGLWFQISNGGGFHETHIHGNCSWSGVYYVQAGQASARPARPGMMPNGITRFYGPYLEFTAGGHGDLGNFYLQDTSWDSEPEDGKLVVFPSHIKHMAFPYEGDEDRVIVSFHAQVHGDEPLRYGYSFS